MAERSRRRPRNVTRKLPEWCGEPSYCRAHGTRTKVDRWQKLRGQGRAWSSDDRSFAGVAAARRAGRTDQPNLSNRTPTGENGRSSPQRQWPGAGL